LKTLIILTPGFPKNEEDTTCVPPQQVFVKALKEAAPGLNIVVLTFQYPFFSKSYQWNGIEVISFGNKNDNKFLRRLSGLLIWSTLSQLNKEHEVIGLLSFWLGRCALYGEKFAKIKNLKHYCWLLGQDAKPGNKYVNRIKPTAASVIALSDFIVQEFNKNYGILPQHVIPVGIDVGLFPAKTEERNIDILGVGSLIPLKQYDVFIGIIASLKKLFPDIKVAICGGGPEMDRLNDLVKTLDLENNVSLVGELQHPEVLSQMQRSKIFLHTSAYEGFGAVCLEALYAGCKVVSFVKPMKVDIENWQIAGDKSDAVQKATAILEATDIQFKPALPYNIHDNAKVMLKLLAYNDAVIA
jgi:glycosyltransferase involved in cell wall biosynthesis